MQGFYDVCCAKCRRKYGFSGRFSDQPPCPRCGHKTDPVALAEDQKKIDEYRELLCRRPVPIVCYRQRVAAGLGLGQGAKILGLTRQELADIELGRAKMPEGMAEKMAVAYGLRIDGPDSAA
jgi:hypothetical protein